MCEDDLKSTFHFNSYVTFPGRASSLPGWMLEKAWVAHHCTRACYEAFCAWRGLCQTILLLTVVFFIAALNEKTPETAHSVLMPEFELPLSTLGKSH